MLKDFGRDVKITIRSDATAAIGICRRLGFGRVRHLATADFWIQQLVRQRKCRLEKWPGPENPADLLQHLGRPDLARHLATIGVADRITEEANQVATKLGGVMSERALDKVRV